MEESIKLSYEQGKSGSPSLLISISIGFSLFWMVFYTTLLYDPFIPLGEYKIGPAYPLAAAMLIGFAITDLTISKLCDFFSKEQGHKTMQAIVYTYGVLPSLVLLSHLVGNICLHPAFSLVAWFIMGIGLACMLALWSELLSAFTKGFASKAIAISACIGALLFFIASNMPVIVGVITLCVASPLSYTVLWLAEKEVPGAPYVPRAESLKRHKLTRPIDALNTLYGVVFGVSIYGLAKEEPSVMLFGLIALALAAGAAFMIPFLNKNTDRMMHGQVQKIIFPLLVIGLLPLSLMNKYITLACLLVIVTAYVCLTLVNLDSLYCLVKRYKTSTLYLVGRGHSPILVGVAAGYLIGYTATVTGVMKADYLSMISLVLVVLLSIFITIIKFDPDHLQIEHSQAEEAQAKRALEEQTREALEELQRAAAPEGGRWKAKCAYLAEKHGLSAREFEVFELLAKGRGTSYIQDRLYISPHTVKTHTYKIYKKLDVSSREELLTLIEKTHID